MDEPEKAKPNGKIIAFITFQLTDQQELIVDCSAHHDDLVMMFQNAFVKNPEIEHIFTSHVMPLIVQKMQFDATRKQEIEQRKKEEKN